MSLVVCSDVSPATWIVTSNKPWERIVTIGPAGFAAYARMRFIPDPTYRGQQEHEADLDALPNETEQWRALLHLLAADTAHPDDCYFGLWDGWGFPESARRWPTFAVPPDAQIPTRSYFLFHGSLSEAEIWGSPAQAGIWGPEFSQSGTPAFVWPSDHAWCVAADTDPQWARIGASVPTIERLIADRRIDAVEADPTEDQPAYRCDPFASTQQAAANPCLIAAEIDFRSHARAALSRRLWTAPGLDDTSWLLLLMFVSASLFLDYRSERPTVAVRPLTAFRRGLSGSVGVTRAFSGAIEPPATRSTPTVETRRVVSASEALGEVDATDPLAEIWPSSAGWATLACARSNSIGDR